MTTELSLAKRLEAEEFPHYRYRILWVGKTHRIQPGQGILAFTLSNTEPHSLVMSKVPYIGGNLRLQGWAGGISHGDIAMGIIPSFHLSAPLENGFVSVGRLSNLEYMFERYPIAANDWYGQSDLLSCNTVNTWDIEDCPYWTVEVTKQHSCEKQEIYVPEEDREVLVARIPLPYGLKRSISASQFRDIVWRWAYALPTGGLFPKRVEPFTGRVYLVRPGTRNHARVSVKEDLTDAEKKVYVTFSSDKVPDLEWDNSGMVSGTPLAELPVWVRKTSPTLVYV